MTALQQEIAGLLGHLTAQHRERIAGEWRRLPGGGAGAITEDPAALAAVLADGAALGRLRERLGALQLHAVAVAQRLPEPFLSDRLQEELILGGLGAAQAVALVGELSGRWGLLLPAQRATQVALQQMALHGGVALRVLPGLGWEAEELPVQLEDLPEQEPELTARTLRADGVMLAGSLVELLALAAERRLGCSKDEVLHANQSGTVERLPGGWLPGRLLAEVGRAAGLLRLQESAGPGPELSLLAGEFPVLIQHLFWSWFHHGRFDGPEPGQAPALTLPRRRLRAMVFGWVRRLPVEQWIGLDHVLERLDQQISPEATLSHGVAHPHLDALCMILGIGHASGIIDLSLPPALASWEALQEALIGPGGFDWRQSRLIRIRITDAGAALLARQSPEPPRALAGAQVHPDGRLLIPAACNHPDMWTIARLASPEEGYAPVRTWRFSLSKWRVAQLAGADLAQVRAVLARASGRPMPEELTRQLEQWSHNNGQVTIYSGFHLRVFPDPAARDAWVAAHPAGQALGGRMALEPARGQGGAGDPPAILYGEAPPQSLHVQEDGTVEVQAGRADLRVWPLLEQLCVRTEGASGGAGWRIDPARLRANPRAIAGLRARARSLPARIELALSAAQGQIAPAMLGTAEILYLPGAQHTARLLALPELRPHLIGTIGPLLLLSPGSAGAVAEILRSLGLPIHPGILPDILLP